MSCTLIVRRERPPLPGEVALDVGLAVHTYLSLSEMMAGLEAAVYAHGTSCVYTLAYDVPAPEEVPHE